MYFPIFLQCNYLYKVWRNVENFPHVVFFCYLAREIFLPREGNHFCDFCVFSIFCFFDIEKSLQDPVMVNQKNNHAGRDDAASAKAKRKTTETVPTGAANCIVLQQTKADAARSVPTLTAISPFSFLLSPLSFLLSPLIPLCGLDFAHARQNQVRLASALA